ncbi:hypothetical protein [Moraxella lacunata]
MGDQQTSQKPTPYLSRRYPYHVYHQGSDFGWCGYRRRLCRH